MSTKAGRDCDYFANATDEYMHFLRTEYGNVSEAHFKTVDSISAFFKSYLVLLTIPIPVVAVVLGFMNNCQQVWITATYAYRKVHPGLI